MQNGTIVGHTWLAGFHMSAGVMWSWRLGKAQLAISASQAHPLQETCLGKIGVDGQIRGTTLYYVYCSFAVGMKR